MSEEHGKLQREVEELRTRAPVGVASNDKELHAQIKTLQEQWQSQKGVNMNLANKVLVLEKEL